MRQGHWKRKRLRQRRAERIARGIPERRRLKAVRVDTGAIPVPQWAIDRRIRDTSWSANHVWLRRGDAEELAKQDRELGGEPQLTETEYRRCKICKRLLLGEDAAALRGLAAASVTGDQLPCGSECLEAAREHRWRRAI